MTKKLAKYTHIIVPPFVILGPGKQYKRLLKSNKSSVQNLVRKLFEKDPKLPLLVHILKSSPPAGEDPLTFDGRYVCGYELCK